MLFLIEVLGDERVRSNRDVADCETMMYITNVILDGAVWYVASKYIPVGRAMVSIDVALVVRYDTYLLT